MKISNIFGMVLILHVLVLSILFIQPGCTTIVSKFKPMPEETIPDETIPEDTLAALAKAQTDYGRRDREVHPDFNAGVEPVQLVSKSKPGRYSPTRPTWNFEQDNFSEAGELLEPLGGKTFSFEDIYIVKRGDSLWSIAQSYGISLTLLLDINGFSRDTVIYAGQEIIIPVDPKSLEEKYGIGLEEFSGTIYNVMSGDTLTLISRMHNTSVAALKSANALRGDTIYTGQKLIVPEDAGPSAPSIADMASITQIPGADNLHIVLAGDTPIEIAQRYRINVMDLMAVNNIDDPRKLRVGQVLIIPDRQVDDYPSLEALPQVPEEPLESEEFISPESLETLSLEDLESILFDEEEIPMVPVDEIENR